MGSDAVGEGRLEDGPPSPLLELDLGESAGSALGDPGREPGEAAGSGRPPSRLRLPGPGWAWGLAVGALLGGLVVHAAGLGGRAPAPSPAPAQQLRLAFGAYGSNVEEQLDHGLAVVDLFAVVANDGPVPLTLEAVHLTGPGAALVDPGPRWQRVPLPLVVPPGQERDLPLALTSDCAVAVRPLPALTLVVHGPDGVPREQPAPVPDLGRLWGQTLDGGPCPAARTPTHSFAP